MSPARTEDDAAPTAAPASKVGACSATAPAAPATSRCPARPRPGPRRRRPRAPAAPWSPGRGRSSMGIQAGRRRCPGASPLPVGCRTLGPGEGVRRSPRSAVASLVSVVRGSSSWYPCSGFLAPISGGLVLVSSASATLRWSDKASHARAGGVSLPAVVAHERHQGGNVQVLHDDRAVAAGEGGGDGMHRLATQVGRPPIKGRQLGSCLAVASGADDAAGRLPGEPAALGEGQSPGGGMGDPLDAAVGMRDHRPLLADAQVDPAAGVGLARAAGGMGDDRGDRDEQPATMLAERHRQDPRPTLAEQPLQPPGVLLAAKLPDDREGEVAAVGFQPHRAGGEPDPATVATTGLEPGEPDPTAGSVAVPGARPVLQCLYQVGDPAGVSLLGAGRPPRRDLILGLVPCPAEGRQRPRQRRDCRVGGAGIQISFDLRHRPVVGEPAGAEMPQDERPLLRGGRLHLKPPAARDPAVGNLVVRPPAHQGPVPLAGSGGRLAQVTARMARLRAPRRPYNRAQKPVSTSIMSRTRSSPLSPGSTTTSRRPCADSAASSCSTPKRASRSRCSTMITVACGSASSRLSFGRLPSKPEPTSVTTSATATPCPVAHAVSRATCRSRSARWSWAETRAYSTARPPDGLSGASTRIVPDGSRRAGTGMVPWRNQR